MNRTNLTTTKIQNTNLGHRALQHCRVNHEKTCHLFILSLNSDRMVSMFASGEIFDQLPRLEEGYICLHMKDYEVKNYMFFHKVSQEVAERVIKNRLVKIRRSIQKFSRDDLQVKSFEKHDANIYAHIKAVRAAYIQHARFRRSLLNQIYQNLQPKLQRLGIRNGRDPQLKKLAPFLITELGILRSFLETPNSTLHLISSAPRMELFSRITSGYYSSISESPSKLVRFKQF